MNSLKVIFDRDTWQEIFGSISKNKTRTVITVIGVLWGIFIYVALSGAAKGLDNGLTKIRIEINILCHETASLSEVAEF